MITATVLFSIAGTFAAYWFAWNARFYANMARIDREASEKLFKLTVEHNGRMDVLMRQYIETLAPTRETR